MRYRIGMDVSVKTEDEALKLIDIIQNSGIEIMDAIKPQVPSMTMPKYLWYSECRHDEVPPAPGGPYIMIDLESKTQMAARIEAEALAAKEPVIE